MREPPTADDARQSLTGHVAEKGREIRGKFGPRVGWAVLQRLLEDRTVVRYPCAVVFSADGLEAGEFAHPVPLGKDPEDGFEMRVHPLFRDRLDEATRLVLYQLVAVNYGGFASAEDAETFGAEALGIDRNDYYEQLCRLADEVAGLADGGPCSCGGC